MATHYRFELLSKEDQQIFGRLDEENVSAEVWRHAEHPCNAGVLSSPDGEAELTGICEDTISFQLRLRNETINTIRFRARGCGFTVACGSMATRLVSGSPVALALGITGEKIAKALGGLPKGHIHCADLAANALRAAVRDALG